MPQVFQVLRCYQCLVFQVHQAKKTPKWECKLCGEKQSIKRCYGVGTAKDCRLHVQRLNALRGEVNETLKSKVISDANTDDVEEQLPQKPKRTKAFKSKWKSYIDDVEEQTQEVTESNEDYMSNVEVVLEIPRKKSRKTKWQPPSAYCRSNNISNTFINTENCMDKNYPTSDIETDKIHWQQKMVNIKKEDQSIPHTNSGQAFNTSQVSGKVNIKEVTQNRLEKKSKWAEYVQEDEESQPLSSQEYAYTFLEKTHTTTKCHNTNMFALNDDDDLDVDDFLNF